MVPPWPVRPSNMVAAWATGTTSPQRRSVCRPVGLWVSAGPSPLRTLHPQPCPPSRPPAGWTGSCERTCQGWNSGESFLKSQELHTWTWVTQAEVLLFMGPRLPVLEELGVVGERVPWFKPCAACPEGQPGVRAAHAAPLPPIPQRPATSPSSAAPAEATTSSGHLTLPRGSASPSSTGAAKATATSSTRRRSARSTAGSPAAVGGPAACPWGLGGRAPGGGRGLEKVVLEPTG